MSNSRMKLMQKTDEPVVGPTGDSANSRAFQKILENTYKPGFIDKTSEESLKMSVDYELAEISKALFQTSERESNLIVDTETAKKLVSELKVEVDGNKASITEVKEVTIENEKAVAKLEVTVESNYEETNAKIVKTDQTVAELDRATAESIRELKAEIEGGEGSLSEKLEVIADKVAGIETEWSITSDVNGKIAGVQLINGTNKKSEFNVLADVFKVSHDADAGIAPFEIVDGKTKIRNAVVGTIHSDNWDGGSNGWAVTKEGFAAFNDVTVRGHIIGQSGILNNLTIAEDCNILGTARIADAQVNTLQIAGNAVTIPVSKTVYMSPATRVPAGTEPFDVGCVVDGVVYSDKAEVIFLSSGVAAGHGPTDIAIRMQILKNGVPVGEAEISTSLGNGWTTVSTFMTNLTIHEAGTYSFRALVGNRNPNTSGYYDLSNLSISILGTKR